MNELIRLSKFWKGKKVFITGHTGFKGTWLCIFLELLGSEVYGYSNNDKNSNFLFLKTKIKKKIKKSFVGDIRDYTKLKKIINNVKPDILIHLAAQSLVRESYLNPIKTYDVNIMGTVNILNILNEIRSIKCSLIITTDKVYENHNKKLLFNEIDKLGGNDPYGNSKACADIISNFYIKNILKNKNSIGIVRSGNIIGGGDIAKDRIIPDYFRALKNKKTLSIRYPNAIRPWQHVIEPLHGYLLLCEKLYKKELFNLNPAWNFGPEKKNITQVKNIIYRLNLYFNNKVKIKIYRKNNTFYESKILMLDSSKAKKILKWKNRTSLTSSIKLIHEWYSYIEKKKSYFTICRKQILDFLRKI